MNGLHSPTVPLYTEHEAAAKHKGKLKSWRVVQVTCQFSFLSIFKRYEVERQQEMRAGRCNKGPLLYNIYKI